MQNPLTQILFFAWIYNSFIISHLLEWLKVRQIKSGIRVNFDQCARFYIVKSRFFKNRELYWSNLPQNPNFEQESFVQNLGFESQWDRVFDI